MTLVRASEVPPEISEMSVWSALAMTSAGLYPIMLLVQASLLELEPVSLLITTTVYGVR